MSKQKFEIDVRVDYAEKDQHFMSFSSGRLSVEDAENYASAVIRRYADAMRIKIEIVNIS